MQVTRDVVMDADFGATDADWIARTMALAGGNGRARHLLVGLVQNLAAIGGTNLEPNCRNKISRGDYAAAFMMQCLAAMEVTILRLDD